MVINYGNALKKHEECIKKIMKDKISFQQAKNSTTRKISFGS
jgi:hypothetical protein